MKFIIITFFLISAAIATPIVLNKNVEKNIAQTETITAKQEVSTKDSISWFEKNLDIYIENNLISFNTIEYKHNLTPEIKKELSLNCWLGEFTISDMISEKNLTTINCSKEEESFYKLIFITPKFLAITTYTISENGMPSGSSILYNPKTNTLIELESIIKNANQSHLEGFREYYSETGEYVIEYGKYNVNKGKFDIDSIEHLN